MSVIKGALVSSLETSYSQPVIKDYVHYCCGVGLVYWLPHDSSTGMTLEVATKMIKECIESKGCNNDNTYNPGLLLAITRSSTQQLAGEALKALGFTVVEEFHNPTSQHKHEQEKYTLIVWKYLVPAAVEIQEKIDKKAAKTMAASGEGA